MRKLYILLIIAFLAGACEDWIEMTPENSVTFDNAFETEKDVESALFATEQNVRFELTTWGCWQPWMRGEFSDYRSVTSRDLLTDPNLMYYTQSWSANYRVIVSANVALPYLDQVKMKDERRDFYRGEIAFFKAFAYLDLIRRFGDCVLLKDEVVLDPIGKTTWPKVADYAIEQAKEAVRLLPEWNEL